MTDLWNKTIDINKELAAKLIGSQMDINIKTIELIGEGFDNVAFLINKNIVFRFPRREISIELLKTETELLPFIAKNISFSISSPQYLGKSTKAYPYPFIGYSIINGNLLCDFANPPIKLKQFAIQFAKALKELHSIPIRMEDQNKYLDTWRLDIENRTQRLNETIIKYKSVYQINGFNINSLTDIIAQFRRLQFSPYKKCYVHGDLYSKHIIVHNDGNLNGLIDWGDVHIGHPSIDISSAIMLFDDNLVNEFYENYGDFDLEVAVFRIFCHSMLALPYAYQKQDRNLLKWSKYALARSIKLFNYIF